MGPLSVHATNPRYFTDGSGKAVYLTGSHTWWNLQDRGEEIAPPFGYTHFLDALANYNHNFFRLWVWEQAAWVCWAKRGVGFRFSPLPYVRSGPGKALDGGLKFDLSRANEEYFHRLRARVEEAGRRGLYVAVMLFHGWSIEMKHYPKSNGNPWEGHPFHRANNINGMNGDPENTGEGKAVHTLQIPQVTALQQAYVRKVIDTVGDLDNVLYEIANESGAYSTDWQYHIIRYIKEYEARKPKQHPVGMTFQYQGGSNDTLFKSPADWVSPNPGGNDAYRRDPPPADGMKVIISDTDHLWGIGGSSQWVWKSFTRGLNPIFMDPWEPDPLKSEEWDEATRALDCTGIRRAMGQTRNFAQKMDLAAMLPLGELASTGYCLADPVREYLTYLPEGGSVTVDLSAVRGEMVAEWFDPAQCGPSSRGKVKGGAREAFAAPFEGQAVLHLSQP